MDVLSLPAPDLPLDGQVEALWGDKVGVSLEDLELQSQTGADGEPLSFRQDSEELESVRGCLIVLISVSVLHAYADHDFCNNKSKDPR